VSEPMQPELLLTGANGFIGSVLAPLLGSQTLALGGRAQVDLCQREAVLALPPVKTIVHLAGASTTFAFDAQPEEAWRTNFLSCLNLLEYARLNQVEHFILASTYVYGPPQYLPVDEKHPIYPHHAYQRSKYLCEQLCEQYVRDYGLKLSILRFFNVYGPGQDPRMLIPTILAQLPQGQIHLRDAAPRRDFIAVKDIASACVAVVQQQAQGIFNLGSGSSVSVAELVQAILRIFGKDLPVHYRQEIRRNEVDEVVADTAHAFQVLGWQPLISLDQGLQELICAY
jgi:nucleoside-diphosphate-sugar epimerase